MSKKSHTKDSDITLLIQFVEDQGFDEPDLVEAADRLQKAMRQGLSGYSFPILADSEEGNRD